MAVWAFGSCVPLPLNVMLCFAVRSCIIPLMTLFQGRRKRKLKLKVMKRRERSREQSKSDSS